MIQIFFNNDMQCFEAFLNGVLIETAAINVETILTDLPRATLTAFVEIVDERPGNNE